MNQVHIEYLSKFRRVKELILDTVRLSSLYGSDRIVTFWNQFSSHHRIVKLWTLRFNLFNQIRANNQEVRRPFKLSSLSQWLKVFQLNKLSSWCFCGSIFRWNTEQHPQIRPRLKKKKTSKITDTENSVGHLPYRTFWFFKFTFKFIVEKYINDFQSKTVFTLALSSATTIFHISVF